MISKVEIIKRHLLIFENVEIGTYRGEDSGAIYPEYQEEVTLCYNLEPIIDHYINGQTISELLISLEEDMSALSKGEYSLYLSLNRKTPRQVMDVYAYIMTLSYKDNLLIKI